MCADPSWPADWRIIFLLSRHSVFTDEPRFVSWKVLLAFVLDALRRSIGGPHTNSREASFQLSLGPVSPTQGLPLGIGEHVFGRHRQDIRNVPLAGTAPSRNWPDQLDGDRVHLEMTRDANSPGNATCR